VLRREHGRVPSHCDGGPNIALRVADRSGYLHVTCGAYILDQDVISLTPFLAILGAPTVIMGDDLFPYIVRGVGREYAAGRTRQSRMNPPSVSVDPTHVVPIDAIEVNSVGFNQNGDHDGGLSLIAQFDEKGSGCPDGR
jgi:hypothetical protein